LAFRAGGLDLALELELTYDRGSSQATATVEDPGNWRLSATFYLSSIPTTINLGTDYATTAAPGGVAYYDDLEIRTEVGSPFDGWDETNNGVGDAGDLPSTAQKVTATDARPCRTPVRRVRGVLEANDTDLYVICVTERCSGSSIAGTRVLSTTMITLMPHQVSNHESITARTVSPHRVSTC